MSLNFDDEATPPQVPELTNVDTSQRVNASDKRMINATTDVNQLVPFKYKWAWQMYLDSCNNHWMPQEYKMDTDVQQMADGVVTSTELITIQRAIGALVLSSGGAGHIAMHVYRHITAPEARQYLLRQGFEEALVPHVYAHMVEKLKLDEEVLLAPQSQPNTFYDKQRYGQSSEALLGNPSFRMDEPQRIQAFVREMVVYICAMKGLFSITDFVRVLALGQQNKMPDLAQQFSLMLRDQQTQVEFGLEVIQAIRNENPSVWTPDLVRSLQQVLKEAVALELAHAIQTANPEDRTASQFGSLLQLVANRMAIKIGLGPVFASQPNPFPWVGEALGLQENRSIAATPVIENKVATTLDWD